jgi:hypothetical protein
MFQRDRIGGRERFGLYLCNRQRLFISSNDLRQLLQRRDALRPEWSLELYWTLQHGSGKQWSQTNRHGQLPE